MLGTYDMSAMMQHHQTATVVNGMQFGYVPNMAHNLLVNGDPAKKISAVFYKPEMVLT